MLKLMCAPYSLVVMNDILSSVYPLLTDSIIIYMHTFIRSFRTFTSTSLAMFPYLFFSSLLYVFFFRICTSPYYCVNIPLRL